MYMEHLECTGAQTNMSGPLVRQQNNIEQTCVEEYRGHHTVLYALLVYYLSEEFKVH